MIDTPAHAIELLGGFRPVTDHLGVPYTTVASWATRQSIPASMWVRLIEFAKEKNVEGFTADALLKAHVDAPKAKERVA